MVFLPVASSASPCGISADPFSPGHVGKLQGLRVDFRGAAARAMSHGGGASFQLAGLRVWRACEAQNFRPIPMPKETLLGSISKEERPALSSKLLPASSWMKAEVNHSSFSS